MLYKNAPRRSRGILRFALPLQTLARDFRQDPRRAIQRLRGYADKLRRQRALARNTVSLSFLRQALIDSGASCLIIDHDSGGGVALFREQMVQAKLATGEQGLTLQYLNALGIYALHAWNGPSALISDFATVLEFLKSLDLKRIVLNNVVGYPEPFAALDGVRDLIGALAAQGCRLEVWLHDFYPLCPSYHLMNNRQDFCGAPDDLAECACCLPDNSDAGAFRHADIVTWREQWRLLLESADSLLASDQSVAEIFLRGFPGLSRPITVQRPPNACLWEPLPPPPAGAPLVIGVPGTITGPKGARLVEGLVALLREQKRTGKIVVIGRLESSLRSPVLHVHGPYARDDLPALMRQYQVTVGLVPSICAETFCYAAEEIMALGLPLVCLDRGAQGAKARGYAKGAVIRDADPRACLQALNRSHERFVLNRTGHRSRRLCRRGRRG